jgi:hypothetical protein
MKRGARRRVESRPWKVATTTTGARHRLLYRYARLIPSLCPIHCFCPILFLRSADGIDDPHAASHWSLTSRGFVPWRTSAAWGGDPTSLAHARYVSLISLKEFLMGFLSLAHSFCSFVPQICSRVYGFVPLLIWAHAQVHQPFSDSSGLFNSWYNVSDGMGL